MRVALHTGQLHQRVPGGIGRYVEGILARLPAAGVEVAAFAGSPWRYEAWHRCRLPRPRLGDADVVHAPSLAVPPTRQRPLVVTVHDLAFVTHPECFTARGVRFHRRALEVARREAAAVVAPSAFTAGELVGAGFPPERVHVVPHGIDLPPPAPDEAATGHPRLAGLGVAQPYLLFVGTIEPRKGVGVVVAAHRSLRHRWGDLALVVAGPPGWGAGITLDGAGVVAPGRVADDVLDALYRGAVALAVPSRTEGFGLPALEAMARGCPVVCSDGGALPEVVGDAGVVVPGAERDAEALAGALSDLLADDDRRRRLGEAGRQRAGRFTWEACLEGHRQAYQAALERTP